MSSMGFELTVPSQCLEKGLKSINISHVSLTKFSLTRVDYQPRRRVQGKKL